MEWHLIIKSSDNQPPTGTYRDWKEQISDECFNQCVYCSVHESSWGGIRNYQIDHFRPKSLFSHLENNILNLFYSCPICNQFKYNDWPNEPDCLDKICYPDPSRVDYNTLFDSDDNNILYGRNKAANYLINRLLLNRPQLIYERKENDLRNKCELLVDEIGSLLDDPNKSPNSDIKEEFCKLLCDIIKLDNRRRYIRPYKLAETRRK